MQLTYHAFETIPLKANFINYISGVPVDITFNVPANFPLTSGTTGIVKFSVFQGGTSSVAVSTLNGSPFPLQNLYMNTYSASGNFAVYPIVEGLSGGTTNAVPYDVSAYYRLTDASGNTILEIPVSYTFYVNPASYNINPRLP